MHELGIALEIHRACREHAPADGRLESVTVAIGELSSVEPELLRHAWEATVAAGPDAGAVLEIEWHPARQICSRCGDVPERSPGTWLRLCPRCGDPLRVDGGDQLDLLRFTFLRDGPEGGLDSPPHQS
ncbi:MAG: hydrogenase maturation nickel metallochaperone HypA [Acidobacteriota bacterium]|jgi:hydrogenase nickel incorporation protein HypA/HybF